MSQKHQPWTDERRSEALRLYQGGMSAGDIARKLRGTTRNAVIGVVNRAGLGNTRQQQARVIKTKPKFRHNLPIKPAPARLTNHRKSKDAPTAASKPLPPEQPAPPKMVKLADLKGEHCRWPFGDPRSPDFGFCGAQPDGDSPYCKHHRAVAFTALRGPPKRDHRAVDHEGRR